MEKDRSWMYGEKTEEFVTGLREFCNSALEHQARTGEEGFYCPCASCGNVGKVNSIGLLREHILFNGFRPQYHIWVYHGEEGFYKGSSSTNDVHDEENMDHLSGENVGGEHVDFQDDEHDQYDEHDQDDETDEDCVDEMMEGVEDDVGRRCFESLMVASKQPLYPSCEKEVTLLSIVPKLFNIKAKNNWSDTSFTSLLELLSEILPKDNVLPKSNYYTSDEDYDNDKEPDKGDLEDQEHSQVQEKQGEKQIQEKGSVIHTQEKQSVKPTQEKPPVKQTRKRKQVETQTQENEVVTQTQEKQAETQTSKQARKPRGPNKGLNVTEPMYLEYNKKGQPCGPFKKPYTKHVGHCVRKLNILHDWKQVPKGLLKTLWEDTVNLFHIDPTEEKQKLFYSSLSSRFRTHKSKLKTGYITLTRDITKPKKPRPEDESRKVPDRMPYEFYTNISKEDWDAFVDKKNSPTRVQLSEKNSENAKQRDMYHRMGPKDFDDWRPIWIKDGIYPNVSATTSVDSSSLATTISDRTSDYACSHFAKDADGKWVIPDEKAKIIVESLMEWKKKESTGEFKRMGDKDGMYMVLGKDHSGRVKGHGGVRVGKKKAFGEEFVDSRRKSTSNTPPVDIEALRAKIKADVEKKMTIRLNSMLEPFGVKMTVEENVVTPNDQSSHPTTPHELGWITPQLREVQPPFPFPNVTEETPCDLLHPNDCGDLVVVAYGQAQPRKENEIAHFKKVEDSNWRVSVDTVNRDYENLPLPFPQPEVDMNTLLQAHLSFIEWPCDWIRFSNKVLEKYFPSTNKGANGDKENGNKENQDKEKLMSEKKLDSQPRSGGDELRLSSKGSNVTKKAIEDPLVKPPQATPLVNEQVLKSLTESCFWLHTCFSILPDDKPLDVPLDKSQFHYQVDVPMWLYKQDIREFLSRDMLCVSIIHVFMSAIGEDLKSCASVSKVGWLCPTEIRADNCLRNISEAKEYIARSLIECARTGDNFIIAPYLEKLHWYLLVISPSNHTVYVFDSAQPNKPQSLIIKSLLNSEMVKMRANTLVGKPSIPTWKTMRCAQQQNGVDCGLYVMKFMLDVVSSCTCATDLEKVYNTPRYGPFTDAEVNEVREKFASYVTDHCVF